VVAGKAWAKTFEAMWGQFGFVVATSDAGGRPANPSEADASRQAGSRYYEVDRAGARAHVEPTVTGARCAAFARATRRRDERPLRLPRV